ncbi:hypothetical protein TD95_003977, partial [Thielaviopsis punctulata]
EEERPLFEEDVSDRYGSFNDEAIIATEDGIESRQESEALQRVVARTTDNMVDVYEISDTTRPAPAPFAYSGQEARLARYQTLLSRIAGNDDAVEAIEITTPPLLVSADEGMATTPLELSAAGLDKEAALVGTFADAAAAMQ